jgi:formamidopyrimidine-DNA glycosylase
MIPTPARRCMLRRGLRCSAPVRMPEGPEVAVHVDRLNEVCSGQRLLRAQILSGRYVGHGDIPGRAAPPADWLAFQAALPAVVTSVRFHGKFSWWRLEPEAAACQEEELTLWSTLGMTGAWTLEPNVHSRVAFELGGASADSDATWQLYFTDQRNFGTLTVCRSDARLNAKLASLGPSWLSADGILSRDAFMAVVLKQCASKRSANVAVAKFLMDQGKTAGSRAELEPATAVRQWWLLLPFGCCRFTLRRRLLTRRGCEPRVAGSATTSSARRSTWRASTHGRAAATWAKPTGMRCTRPRPMSSRAVTRHKCSSRGHATGSAPPAAPLTRSSCTPIVGRRATKNWPCDKTRVRTGAVYSGCLSVKSVAEQTKKDDSVVSGTVSCGVVRRRRASGRLRVSCDPARPRATGAQGHSPQVCDCVKRKLAGRACPCVGLGG